MPPDAHLFYCFPQVFPAICAAIFLVINIVIWAHQSSMAVPFGTSLVVVVLWFVISLPLVFLGAYFGFRKDVISVPCRTNQIPREVPPQLWYQGLVPSLVVGGLLPFGAVFVELFFILSSIWQHRFYYMFGFLFLVFIGGPFFFLPCLRGATLLARLRCMLSHAGVC